MSNWDERTSGKTTDHGKLSDRAVIGPMMHLSPVNPLISKNTEIIEGKEGMLFGAVLNLGQAR